MQTICSFNSPILRCIRCGKQDDEVYQTVFTTKDGTMVENLCKNCRKTIEEYKSKVTFEGVEARIGSLNKEKSLFKRILKKIF